MRWSLLILPEGASGGKAVLACSFQTGSTSGPERLAAAVVLVVGGDVADALVEPDGVVVLAQPVQLGLEVAGIGDLLQVRVLGLGVAEEGLDPGLVGRGAGTAEALSDVNRHGFSAAVIRAAARV